MQKLQAAWKDLKQWGKDVFAGLAGDVRLFWQALSDWGVINGIKDAFLGLGHVIHGFFTDNWKEAVDGARQAFSGLGEIVMGPLRALWGTIKAWAAQLWADIKDSFAREIADLFKGIKLPSFSDLLGGAGDAAKTAGDALGGAAKGALSLGEQAAGALKDGLSKAGDLLGGLFSDAGPKTEEAGAKVEAGMAQTAGMVKQGFNAAWSATRDFAVTQFSSAAVTIQGIFAGIVSGIETQVGNLVMGAQRMAGGVGMVPAAAGVRAQQAGGNRSFSQTNNNRITIHAPGGDPRAVQQGVQRGLSQSNKVNPAQSGTVVK